jgi:hypothetical protein
LEEGAQWEFRRGRGSLGRKGAGEREERAGKLQSHCPNMCSSATESSKEEKVREHPACYSESRGNTKYLKMLSSSISL